MLRTVLVANRGEIAVRIIATLRRMAIRSVAVYSDADAGAPHVVAADTAVRLGPAAAGRSYLSIERVIDAARTTGADGIHPGYGFLSENARFARACAAAGIVFIGPPPEAIELMGDKIRGKHAVSAAGVPVVPGFAERPGEPMPDAELAERAAETGYPVLIKPSAGGGGKGMRVVGEPGELADAVAAARREATSAFGDPTLLVERYIGDPRHIEIQVFADTLGGAVHLGERECSLQRRHQKVVEESPSPLLDDARRAAMGASAVAAARACGYVGAGTVEYIVSAADPDRYHFMEMNTRLQVEHPVTEAVTGLDLVEWQVRVAAGEPLPLRQDEVRLRGHAVEARVYAEDPARGFLPTGGPVLALAEPAGDGVRVDSGIAAGGTVGGDYDPMLAKVIGHGADRATALRRLDRALAGYTVLGLGTNVGFVRNLLGHPDVVAGTMTTGLIGAALDELTADQVPGEIPVAAALATRSRSAPARPGADRFAAADGWRLSGPAWTTVRVRVAGREPVEVRLAGTAGDARVSIAGGQPSPAALSWTDEHRLRLDHAGRSHLLHAAWQGDTLWLGAGGRTWACTGEEPLAAAGRTATATDGVVRSPMPGTVIAVKAAVGDHVEAGTPLLIVEAMKMEHLVTAPVDGRVTELNARVGAAVALDESLATVTASGDGPANE